MSYSEVHRLPIRYRRWYLDRLKRHFEEKNKAYEKSNQPIKPNKNSNDGDLFSRFESQVKNKLT